MINAGFPLDRSFLPIAVPSQGQVGPAIAAFAVGIAVSLLTKSPFGLLAPVAALFLFARGRTVLLLHVVLAIGLIGSLLAAASYSDATRDLAVTHAAFFAVALCIGAIVAASASMAPGAEAVPAAVPSITPDEAPAYPVIGPTLHEKAAPRHAPFVGISAQDDKATAAQLVAVSFWGGTRFHMRYWRRNPDGNYRWVESRTEPLREPSGTRLWGSVTAEIDDQRPPQEPPTRIAFNAPGDDDAVRAAKVVESLIGNAWAFDAAGRPTYLTPLAQTFVAVTLQEFQAAVDEGHTFFKRTAHPDDYDRISAAWRHSLQTGEPFYLDRRIRRASGIHEWNRTGMAPTRDRHGRITGWYGTTIDLDAHRIAEAELRERERELSQLVDMVPSLLWRLSPDGEPNFLNKRAMDFLGLDLADYDKPGMSRLAAILAAIVHPDDAAGVTEALDHSFATGEPFAMTHRLRRADGVYRWVSARAEPMRDESGRIVQWYGLAHDVDDQVRAEEALRRSQNKLARASQAASLGELSASIAHEVNQPLAAIVATSHAARRWLSADPPNLERAKITLDRIIRDANSASEVISRIRALFSQMGTARSPADMAEVIMGVRRLLAEEFATKGIQVETELAPSLPAALIDRVQMEQVLINLIRNAVDALDTMAGGTRLIRLRAVLDSDNAICIEVQDSGPGMKEPEQAFEPFFTTKKDGMGMGLAICRSIIESHNGRLWAISNQPRGTTLAFTLPIQAKDAA